MLEDHRGVVRGGFWRGRRDAAAEGGGVPAARVREGETIEAALARGGVKLVTAEYDWTLNGKSV